MEDRLRVGDVVEVTDPTWKGIVEYYRTPDGHLVVDHDASDNAVGLRDPMSRHPGIFVPRAAVKRMGGGVGR